MQRDYRLNVDVCQSKSNIYYKNHPLGWKTEALQNQQCAYLEKMKTFLKESPILNKSNNQTLTQHSQSNYTALQHLEITQVFQHLISDVAQLSTCTSN